MAYLGTQPVLGNFRSLDNIGSSFDSSTLTYNLTVSSVPVNPSSLGTLIVLNGAVKKSLVDFSINNNQITFATAPAPGTTFFGLIMGDTGITGTPSDASVTNSKIAPATINFDRLSTNATSRILANAIIFGA
jgi:hypothetical protein